MSYCLLMLLLIIATKNEVTVLSFYDFIQKFYEDKTPLGEIARWIEKDSHFPKKEVLPHNILKYVLNLPNVEYETLENLKRAITLFEKFEG